MYVRHYLILWLVAVKRPNIPYRFIMPRWAEPRGIRWCLCFRRKLSRARSPRPLKIKRWNLQCKLNTILSWNEIGGFWIDGFIVELWRDLCSVAHLTAVFRCPESVEEQPAYNGLVFNLVVPSVPHVQSRQWAKLNRENPGHRSTRANHLRSSIRHMPRRKARTSTAQKEWQQPTC